MLYIGSMALYRNGHFLRVPKDLDMICYQGEVDIMKQIYKVVSEKEKHIIFENDDGMKIECEIAVPDSNQEMLMNLLDVGFYTDDIAPPEVVYALKMSHRFLKDSPHFLKTMEDIRYLRKHVSIPEYLEGWYQQRLDDTYWYEHPSLAKSKEDFFDESVFPNGSPYVYDHDTLHEAVKFFDVPAFNYFLNDEVKVSMKKFHALPYNIKLATVVEESCVLALERAIIPHGANQKAAFLKALEKVCTSISSGSWREFAWENYWNARNLFAEKKIDLNDLLQEGLNSGIVKPFKE